MRYGKRASANPWGAVGLEWTTASPPPTFNFDTPPTVDWEAYEYTKGMPPAAAEGDRAQEAGHV